MQLLIVLFIIFVVGVAVFFLQRFPYIGDEFKKLITWVALGLCVVWVILIVAGWLGVTNLPVLPPFHR